MYDTYMPLLTYNHAGRRRRRAKSCPALAESLPKITTAARPTR